MAVNRITGRDPATGGGFAIAFEHGIITSIESTNDYADLWLSPGLIDLQVNGFHGLDLNSDDIEPATVSELTRELLSVGVTTFAPTIITAPEEAILHRLERIAAARANDPIARACIPYIHVEGPHISPLDGYRGAHPVEAVRPPSLAEFDRWQKASGGLVGLVTLSPHFPNSLEYIAALTGQGAHVALGHTNASPAMIQSAVAAGARLSTHLGNGIAPQLNRHPNPIWSQLANDLLTATFIADGHHLPAETLKSMLRAKSVTRSVLVSDTVALAGMPAGRYTTPIGGQVQLNPDGRLVMYGTDMLAGAVTPLIECIGQVVRVTGLSLADALGMATGNPGHFVHNRGRLEPGARADILRFSWSETESILSVQDVWLAGERISP